MLILASATTARAANSTTYLSHSDSGQGNVLACVLSFLAAAISSAAGVGGGSLYVAILSAGAGFSVNTATVFSRFIVTAVSLSNVLYTVFLREPAGAGGEPLIDYVVVVVSQPCLLLGVSVGVLCNAVFPEWLVTALFAAFLAFATFVTYRTGVRRWCAETVALRRIAEDGGDVEGNRQVLLGRRAGGCRRRCHWVDMAVLVLVWLFFFLVHLLVGGRGAKGVFGIKPCGVTYWLITVAQVPIVISFTAYVVRQKRSRNQNNVISDEEISTESMFHVHALPANIFPAAGLHAGVSSGLFSIGGGLLLNPIFFHIGVPPRTASATTMFMILLSSSMSTAQSIIVGVKGVANALVYATICFVASVVGLAAIDSAVRRSGRASLIVLAVAAIMALTAAVVLCSGAARVWAQYTGGEYMGFNLPC